MGRGASKTMAGAAPRARHRAPRSPGGVARVTAYSYRRTSAVPILGRSTPPIFNLQPRSRSQSSAARGMTRLEDVGRVAQLLHTFGAGTTICPTDSWVALAPEVGEATELPLAALRTRPCDLSYSPAPIRVWPYARSSCAG